MFMTHYIPEHPALLTFLYKHSALLGFVHDISLVLGNFLNKYLFNLTFKLFSDTQNERESKLCKGKCVI